jgi:hypothetical protein
MGQLHDVSDAICAIIAQPLVEQGTASLAGIQLEARWVTACAPATQGMGCSVWINRHFCWRDNNSIYHTNLPEMEI